MPTTREILFMLLALAVSIWSIIEKYKSDQAAARREQRMEATHNKVLDSILTNYEVEKTRREEQERTIAAQRGEIESLKALLSSTSAANCRGKIIKNTKEA